MSSLLQNKLSVLSDQCSGLAAGSAPIERLSLSLILL